MQMWELLVKSPTPRPALGKAGGGGGARRVPPPPEDTPSASGSLTSNLDPGDLWEKLAPLPHGCTPPALRGALQAFGMSRLINVSLGTWDLGPPRTDYQCDL